MKVLIFGHSDSDGSQLRDASRGLPRILQQLLAAATETEVEVRHRVFHAGPSGENFLQKELDSFAPDVALLATSTHPVLVEFVSNRVRERWGLRAGRLAHRAENAISQRTIAAGPATKPAYMALRKTARKVFGARPTMTAEQLIACYEQCMMRLARVEGLHTIIGGGIGYTAETRRKNPNMDALQNMLQDRFRELAALHRFDWLSQEAVLGGPGAKEKYYNSDGIHTDERSQRLFAEALLPLVLARV